MAHEQNTENTEPLSVKVDSRENKHDMETSADESRDLFPPQPPYEI